MKLVTLYRAFVSGILFTMMMILLAIAGSIYRTELHVQEAAASARLTDVNTRVAAETLTAIRIEVKAFATPDPSR